MSNKTILQKLLVELDNYSRNVKDHEAFALRVYASIEALEGVPYSVNQQGSDWRQKIETEGYLDDEGFESEINELTSQLKVWINELSQSYS